jgi:hypothetical protein
MCMMLGARYSHVTYCVTAADELPILDPFRTHIVLLPTSTPNSGSSILQRHLLDERTSVYACARDVV